MRASMRRLVWILCVAAMVVAATACGGDSGDGGDTGAGTTSTQATAAGGDDTTTTTQATTGDSGDRTVVVCSLVSTTEAEAWLGAGVVSDLAVGPTAPDPNGCTYTSADGNSYILLQVYDGEKYFGGPDNEELYPNAVVVPGLGEIGFTSDVVGSESYRSVHFLQNDWAVSVSDIAGGIPEDDLLAMAQVVSANLP
jgi:hypothetical protein